MDFISSPTSPALACSHGNNYYQSQMPQLLSVWWHATSNLRLSVQPTGATYCRISTDTNVQWEKIYLELNGFIQHRKNAQKFLRI